MSWRCVLDVRGFLLDDLMWRLYAISLLKLRSNIQFLPNLVLNLLILDCRMSLCTSLWRIMHSVQMQRSIISRENNWACSEHLETFLIQFLLVPMVTTDRTCVISSNADFNKKPCKKWHINIFHKHGESKETQRQRETEDNEFFGARTLQRPRIGSSGACCTYSGCVRLMSDIVHCKGWNHKVYLIYCNSDCFVWEKPHSLVRASTAVLRMQYCTVKLDEEIQRMHACLARKMVLAPHNCAHCHGW